MSARLPNVVWIVALIVTPFGVATANAQPPVFPVAASRSDEPRPEERPTDLRPLVRSLLIGLHPAAGLVDVDCLVDVDDEAATPAFSLREIPDYVHRFMRSVGEPTGQALPIESSTTCPYLKRQKECEHSHSDTKSPPLCDFEENLRKLSAASKLYDMGQAHLRNGDRESALTLFAQIHEMVPGSRYDSQGVEKIDRMGREELTPTLPPIDPKIVDALQKVLKETTNPTVPRLIIHVEEQPPAEEQEAAVPPEWSGEPQEEDIPRLLIDSVDDKLTIASEDDESDEPQEFSSDEWSALLREVIDAIRAGLSEEVEINAVPTSVHHREKYGGIEVEVTLGSGGEQYVRVSLSPEASGDLRAAQRAHNERILRWIESLNEPCAEEDDSAAEEEDAAYGDEPRNEAIP